MKNKRRTPARAERKVEICVVGGAGHVGLPLAVVFANKGKRTLIYDVNAAALERIAEGRMPFMEEGGEPLLRRALSTGKLVLSADPSDLERAATVIITIGTPVDEFMNPDTKVMRECIDRLLPYLADGALVILRSTVYPGTTHWLENYLRSRGKRVLVAFCPERVVQGRAIEEVQKLPQIVSGTTPAAEERAARLFRTIAPEVVRLEPMEAEFAKLFNNAYRFIQFATTNQFYMIANSAGMDYARILRGMKKDYPRSRDIPGAGFAAGPCLLKDTMQLAAFSNNQFSLGHAAMTINEGLVLYLVDQIAKRHALDRLTVGLLGMAFKANSDDNRASLSYKLKRVLEFRAKKVLTTDPHVTTDPHLLPLAEVLRKSDLLVLCVPHDAYRKIKTARRPLVDIWDFFGRGTAV